MRRVLGLELRRTSLRYSVPLLTLLAAAVAFQAAHPQLATWANISTSMLRAASALAPFIAGLCAWEALRARRRRMQATDGTAARPAPLIRLPQLLGALIWLAGSWVVVVAATAIRGATVGLFGSPEVLPLLQSLLLPLAFAVLGVCTAELLTSWIAVPASTAFGLALYLLTFAGTGPDALRWADVLSRFAAPDGWTSNPVYFTGVIVETVGLAALFAALGALRHRPYRYPSAVAALLAGALVVAGAGLAIGQRGRSTTALPEASLTLITVVDSRNRVELRMLEHYRPVAAQLAEAWGRVSALFADTPLAFRRIEQRIDADHADARPFERLYLNPGATDVADGSIAEGLQDVIGCFRDGPAQGALFSLDGAAVVQSWLRGSRDLPSGFHTPDPQRTLEALRWLHELPEHDARAWVTAHLDQILGCDWEPGDFGRP